MGYLFKVLAPLIGTQSNISKICSILLHIVSVLILTNTRVKEQSNTVENLKKQYNVLFPPQSFHCETNPEGAEPLSAGRVSL